jgi:GR25 family glycosyltransferase involved in LPS biosynthesis
MLIILFIFIILLLLNNKTNCKLIESFNTNINKYKQYLINLDHRSDRFNVTNNLLSIFNFKHVIRYPAINGKNMLYNELVNIVDPDAMTSILNNFRKEHHELSYGAVGCYLSHVNIWDELSKLYDTNEIIIFEDDTYPAFSLDKINIILQKHVPSDWDIVLFGGIYNETKLINDNVSKIYKFYQMHAYIINKNGANKLLKKAYPIKKQIDSWLSDLASDNYINIYGVNNNKWVQNSEINNTDIQTIIKH